MKHVAIGHPKFAALRSRLSLDEWEGVGVLETLWLLARRLAPRGDIGRFSDDEIAVGIGWKRTEPSALVGALVETRWLDRNPEHRLVVHGWAEHADGYVHLVVARMREFFADGSRPKPPANIIPSHERAGILKFCKGKPPRKKPARLTSGQGADLTTGLTSGSTTGLPLDTHTCTNTSVSSSPNPSAESESNPTPRTHATERKRGVGSHAPASGNGNGHRPDPNVATPGRIIEHFGKHFPQLLLDDERDHGDINELLEARIASHPEWGDWLHWFDQLKRQPFYIQGEGRRNGRATLAFLVRNERQWLDVFYRREPGRAQHQEHHA